MRSAFDANWIRNAPHRNPFYVALPYNDVDNHHTKPEAVSIIPWFKQAFVRDGQSVCKDRWVAIRKGNRVAYAQWEDVGPFRRTTGNTCLEARDHARIETGMLAWMYRRQCSNSSD